MMDFEGMNATRARLVEGLAKIERAITELDLACKEAWEALDMWSFIGQDIPIRQYLPEPPVEFLKVSRVPLTSKVDGKEKIIGVADLNEGSDVIQALVNEEFSDLFALPGGFSIRDEDPPVWDHDEIKAQLRSLVGPTLYQNPYAQYGNFRMPNGTDVTLTDEMSAADLPLPAVNLKMMVAGAWTDIDQVPDEILDNHPFFKEDGKHLSDGSYFDPNDGACAAEAVRRANQFEKEK